MASILDSVKQYVGVCPDDTAFDSELIIDINSALMVLNQLNVGPESCFIVTGKYEDWDDFLGDKTNLEAAKAYTNISVKLLFDPPASGTILESMTKMKGELEWRLNANAESKLNEVIL